MEGVGKIKAINKDDKIWEIQKTNAANTDFKLKSIMRNFTQFIDVLSVTHKSTSKSMENPK